MSIPVADPGFPVGGGADPLEGGTNLQRVHFSAEMYAKMKEIDPVAGVGRWRRPLDPPMHTLFTSHLNFMCFGPLRISCVFAANYVPKC